LLNEDPKVKLRNLIVDNWVPANVYDVTPKVHTGWYNEAWQAEPQITITGGSTLIAGGQSTGVTAFGGDGRLVRRYVTYLTAGIWAHHEMGLSVNPKEWVYKATSELRSIIEANTFSDPDLDFIAWTGFEDNTEIRIKPVLFRVDNDVRLVYRGTFVV